MKVDCRGHFIQGKEEERKMVTLLSGGTLMTALEEE